MSTKVLQKRRYATLRIQQHPYDYATLEDAIWTPYGNDPEFAEYNRSGNNGFITGTVVEGYTLNRIMGVVSRDNWKTGGVRRFDFCPITRIHKGIYTSHTCG